MSHQSRLVFIVDLAVDKDIIASAFLTENLKEVSPVDSGRIFIMQFSDKTPHVANKNINSGIFLRFPEQFLLGQFPRNAVALQCAACAVVNFPVQRGQQFKKPLPVRIARKIERPGDFGVTLRGNVRNQNLVAPLYRSLNQVFHTDGLPALLCSSNQVNEILRQVQRVNAGILKVISDRHEFRLGERFRIFRQSGEIFPGRLVGNPGNGFRHNACPRAVHFLNRRLD